MLLLRKYIRTILERTESDTPSWMIALYPSRATIRNLVRLQQNIDIPVDAKVLEPGEIHCTIRWWENKDCTDEVTQMMNAASIPLPISCPTDRLEILGESLVVMIDCPELHRTFKIVDEGLKKIGCPPSTFSTFKPHITLYNGATEIPDLDFEFDIVLDKIRLVDGNDKVYWSS